VLLLFYAWFYAKMFSRGKLMVELALKQKKAGNYVLLFMT